MNKLFALAFLVLAISATGAYAQRNVTPAIDRDPIMEADAKHNLDVAWNYYSLKKAYKATLMRFEETFAAYPDFSKIDEFLFIGGMSSYYLSEGKGKQPVDLKKEKDKEKFTPEKLRESAKMYLTMLVDKYPDSKYVTDAKKTLSVLNTEK
ncbi:MAG TPA: outer membrane protein assembly factor BamD [Pyrinomonadaceae bacterium]|nr:outer membrane protein assembly factor BamD [Pyrinomonadaceae bacterium]